MQRTYMLMNTLFVGGDIERRTRWIIWAAKHRSCPRCGAEPWFPCLNLTLLRKMPSMRVAIQRPHDERIDPERLVGGFLKRGYIDQATHDRTIAEMRAS